MLIQSSGFPSTARPAISAPSLTSAVAGDDRVNARSENGGLDGSDELKNQQDRPTEDESIVGDLVRDNFAMASGALGAPAFFAANAYPATWMHEQGHALAIRALFTGPAPTVSVTPFGGGMTVANPNGLSGLGEAVGLDAAKALVAGAGTLVDMGVAATTFGVGFKIRDEHPLIGAALMGYGATTVFHRLGYAATALVGDTAQLAARGHDFANLSVRGGIPPWVSFAVIASLLPLEYVALKWLEDKDRC